MIQTPGKYLCRLFYGVSALCAFAALIFVPLVLSESGMTVGWLVPAGFAASALGAALVATVLNSFVQILEELRGE